ncbi:MAG TPA: autotransporter-associated beta strand repeat-containing protein [Thermoanaerobaculia bacterium]|nr:autotransporter-associated beta strand repeat-containing protein [Thermoanaerobaculia bacterium]
MTRSSLLGITFSLLILIGSGAHAATRTWDGGGGDPFWSTPANWAGDVAPVAGDDLVFPAGALQLTNNNDLGVTFGNILIAGSGYLLQGAQINISNGITTTYGGTSRVHSQLATPVSQTFDVAAGGTLRISTGINNSGVLTLDGEYLVDGVLSGAGSIVKSGAGTLTLANDNTFSGGLTITGGSTVLANDPPGGTSATGSGPVILNGVSVRLGGTGTVGHVTATQGRLIGGNTIADPTLTTGNVVLAPLQGGVSFVLLSPTVSPRIDVDGTIDVTDAFFNFASLGPPPPPGFKFLLIDNDGTDPVIGTFFTLPEGATFTFGGRAYRITYAGGDGNDVVLTASGADLGVTKVADDPSPALGQNVTFTITVANLGAVSATGVTLTDTLPAGLAFVSATPSQGTCNAASPVSCNLGTINGSGHATVTLVATVTAPGSITNTASVTSAGPDPTAANDAGSATINVAASPAGAPVLDARALALLALILGAAGVMALRS